MDYDKIPSVVSALITEDTDETKKYFASVAIVRNRNKWLLGLAKNSGDDREGHWTCPGGHIKDGESPRHAAEREAKEETGVTVRSIADPFDDPDKKGVAFVVCRSHDAFNKMVRPNHEYSLIGWFSEEDMDALRLYKNVRRLIRRAKYR